jgi:hypothetical protein
VYDLFKLSDDIAASTWHLAELLFLRCG